jgi:hypothetical protein
MRTTIDLPPELMRAAKVRAAERGENLKDLFTRAVAREVDVRSRSRKQTGKVRLPLVARDATPSVPVTNADIEAVLAAEDAEKYGVQ